MMAEVGGPLGGAWKSLFIYKDYYNDLVIVSFFK